MKLRSKKECQDAIAKQLAESIALCNYSSPSLPTELYYTPKFSDGGIVASVKNKRIDPVVQERLARALDDSIAATAEQKSNTESVQLSIAELREKFESKRNDAKSIKKQLLALSAKDMESEIGRSLKNDYHKTRAEADKLEQALISRIQPRKTEKNANIDVSASNGGISANVKYKYLETPEGLREEEEEEEEEPYSEVTDYESLRWSATGIGDYIDENSSICEVICWSNTDENRNILNYKYQAEAILALTTLLRVRDELIISKNVSPQKNLEELQNFIPFAVCISDERQLFISEGNNSVFRFPTMEMAEWFTEHNKKDLETFFQLYTCG